MSELERLRSSLSELNRMFFSLIQQRKKLVNDIQLAKQQDHLPGFSDFKNYDPQREWSLFRSFERQFKQLDPKELLSISLLMETHAGSPSSYPEWSKGIHLVKKNDEIFHQLNPLMIRLIDQSSFAALNLTVQFQKLRDIID